MKAMTYHNYGSPEVLRLAEVDKPTPRDNEVLIRIYSASVTNADCVARKGSPFAMRFATGLTRPKKHILGTEFSGVVEAVGASVTSIRKGDEVWAASGVDFGAHAEYICLPDDGAMAAKPDTLSFEEAAAVCEGALTALPFLRDHGKIQNGQRVLINGASGSVGTAAVQLAKHFGAEVTGVCSTANVELVTSLGADDVIDYTRADFTDARNAYDIIFDTVGKSSFSRCKHALKRGGVYLSTVRGLPIYAQMFWTSLVGDKKAKITLTGLRAAKDKSADLIFLKGLIESGKLRPHIDKSYALEDAAQAHRHVETGHKRGNVVLTMSES